MYSFCLNAIFLPFPMGQFWWVGQSITVDHAGGWGGVGQSITFDHAGGWGSPKRGEKVLCNT